MLHPALPLALVAVAAILIVAGVAILVRRASTGQHAWSEGAALTVADLQRSLAEENLQRIVAEPAAGRHHLFTHPHAPLQLAS